MVGKREAPPTQPLTASAGLPNPEQKKKKHTARTVLIAVLCGLVLLFSLGAGVAVLAGGMAPEKRTTSGRIFTAEIRLRTYPAFPIRLRAIRLRFRRKIRSEVLKNDPFGDEENIPAEEYLPNGCSRAEYKQLTTGMTYAQISAIIGGDCGNYFDTVDGEGRSCTVFQWITESGKGYVAVEMIDGKAVDFYAGTGEN